MRRSSKSMFFIRKNRVKSKIQRVSDRPHLSVFKSGRHVYAQVIKTDNNLSYTVASASTLEKDMFPEVKSKCNVQCAKKVGQLLAERAFSKGISRVVFDRSGYKYHGIIQALADSAREKLSF